MNILNKIFFRRNSSFENEELRQYLISLLGFTPRNLQLYEQALTHRSINGESNERLEFLGDALIGFVIATKLYKVYPKQNEGFLTKARSHIVCRDNLNKLSHELGIDQYLQTITPPKCNTENIYGNAFEALVGAIYLDAGYEAAAKFVVKTIVGGNEKRLLKLSEHDTDFKSQLLEYAQSRHLDIRFIQSAERYEQNIDRHIFVFSVLLNETEVASAAGYSKREAQQTAAKKALKYISHNHS